MHRDPETTGGHSMNPDIVSAVVAFLQGAMRGDLGVAADMPQVWADAAPPGTVYPYAVVFEGSETYAYQSTDPETGHWLDCLATGSIVVSFYAATKANARYLGRQAVRLLSDSQEFLSAGDGRVIHMAPVNAVSNAISTTGVGVPDVFLRIVTFQYVQEFGA